ncbi:MAG: AbrB/MazE/SpoVT family DNA-binding domain-containing protein [Desulfurococcus sp.]|jgi:AbrB family looped-hinge helix DNA binding protein|uniref:AbrB/MazE/SpoVT family DNA-binding domain-containing protein n=1 Tax=Desulfurococcus sp. TaxID=51678 RepID=UPI003161199D
MILKVRKKGIIILPKKLREALGVDEGDEVIVEVVGEELVMRALKPRIVDVDPEIAERLLREEYDLERGRYARMI